MNNMNKNDIILKESINNNLKSIKTKKLIGEKYISKRCNKILENKNFNQKNDIVRFWVELIEENERFILKGYSQELISEQLDFLFGNVGKGVLDYFREYVAKYIMKQLGISTDTWLASLIITAAGNLKFGDIPKLGDCKFWAAFLPQTIIESFVTQFQEKKGIDNMLGSVIRNSIENMISSSTFAKMLEDELAKVICPVVTNLGGKISSVMSKLSGTKQA